MAITTTTKLHLPASQLPAGSSNETLTVAAYVGREDFSLTLTPASTYDNATQATALSAIKTAVQAYVEGTLATALVLDTTAGVVGETVITSIVRGWDNFVTGDYKNQYLAATDVFVVHGYFQWLTD